MQATLISEEKGASTPSQLNGSNISFLNSFERNDSPNQKFRIGAVRKIDNTSYFCYFCCIDFKPLSGDVEHDYEQPSTQCAEQPVPAEPVLRERWEQWGKLYNFRNFSVSQTSSKESMVGGGPVPTKVISANLLGGATPPQDFSIVNAPIFNS